MSNYQRLISYIYTYEGGIRGKNIGFAKLETRGSQCRITVNVKKIFVGGNPVGVYLLSGQDEVKIGTLFARNGAGNSERWLIRRMWKIRGTVWKNFMG